MKKQITISCIYTDPFRGKYIEEIKVSPEDLKEKLKEISEDYERSEKFKEIILDGIAPEDCSNLFNNFDVPKINLKNFDTRNTTNMEEMFSSCSELTSLDLSGFDTSSVTNMKRMFEGCCELTNINLENFNTSKVTDMDSMFYNCERLESLSF